MNSKNIAHGYKALVNLVNMMKSLHGDNLDRNVVSGLDSVLGHARNILKYTRNFEAAARNKQTDAADLARTQLIASKQALWNINVSSDLDRFSERMGQRGNSFYAVCDNLKEAIVGTIQVLIYCA